MFDFQSAPRRASISLTPLIDVVFILLLFFMLATQFDVWQSEIVSTVDPSSSEIVGDKDQTIIIVVASDSTISLNGVSLTAIQLEKELSQLGVDAADTLISLRADPGTNVQQLYNVVDLVKSTGLHRLQLTSVETAG